MRFAAPLPGTWTWETSSTDGGLDGHQGRFEVGRPTEEEIADNPNHRGQLEISKNGRCFQYADGTPRLLLADTLWAGNTARCGLGSDADGPFFEYLDDRKAKGFNAILIKYLHGFGDIANNPSGDRNKGGYAFPRRDSRRLNPRYFRALDRRLEGICEHGLVAAVPTTWWGKTKRCAFDLQWAKRISAYCAVRYGAHGIWQLDDPGDEKGETGKKDKRVVPWSEAPWSDGSAMMQPVAAMLTACPWWRLEPRRDSVLVDGKPSPPPTAEHLSPPHCAALPGRFCLVYVPRGNQHRSLTLVGLEGRRYRAGWFDPRDGRSIAVADGPSGQDEWTIPHHPEPREEDWVLTVDDAFKAFPRPERRDFGG